MRRKRRISRRRYERGKNRQLFFIKLCLVGIIVLVAVLIYLLCANIFKNHFSQGKRESVKKIVQEEPKLQVDLLTVNEDSRPGTPLEKINGIVIHYTANPGSTAQENRDYFEGLKDTHETQASSHFIVGIQGEIIQCIPSSEIAYASTSRNKDTLAIECCHPDESGKFSTKTYDSLVQLCAWLCGKFNLEVDSIIRHYDVQGKNCPKYYVENEKEWEKFKQDVTAYIDKYGVAQTP